MVEDRTHDELIQEQFSQQAALWDSYIRSGGNEEVLSWNIGRLDLRSDMRALDVAAGTGVVARAMAARVAQAVAVDVTPEMVAQGRQLAAAEGLSNVAFDEGDARNLPYDDAGFDVVTCRLAMHQFEDPERCLRELVRVCRPGGQVAIIDITTSDDTATAETHNRLERLRDPSHTNALSASRLQEMAERCGLDIFDASYFDVQRNLESWMDLTQTPSESRIAILKELQRELDGGPATGMYPYMQDGQFMFKHRWAMLVGRKR